LGVKNPSTCSDTAIASVELQARKFEIARWSLVTAIASADGVGASYACS
jgi:hypothetical protein